MNSIIDIYKFIYKDCGLGDCDIRKINETDGDIGYFENNPCSILEVRDNKISYFAFGKGINIAGTNNSEIFKPIFDLIETNATIII